MAAPQSVFVAWDTTTPTLPLFLERLPVLRPGGFDYEVLGLRTKAGFIHDQVISGIETADRVLVCTDRPNANVGFEAGFALGLGKPILMVYRGSKLPSWTDTPPLRNYLQGKWRNFGDLEALIGDESTWLRPRRAVELPLTGFCLDLCPREGVGELLRAARNTLDLDEWKRVEDFGGPLKIDRFNDAFAGAARLVWTITDALAESSDQQDLRDGALNTAYALIAGWFYSRCHRQPNQDMPFWVLRLAGTRDVQDVKLFELPYEDVPDYASIIAGQIEPMWRAMRAHYSEGSESEDEQSSIRIAIIPFDSPDDSEDGRAFADGLTDDLIAAVGEIDLVEAVPRTSTVPVRDLGIDNDHAADLLSAQYIVRGSLIQQGRDCLIEVRLFLAGASVPIRSYRRRHLWDDVLSTSVAAKIAGEIATSINRRLTADLGLGHYDKRAKELFWKASQALDVYNNVRDPEAAERARRLLFRTINADESYQEARVKMGFLDVVRWETKGDPDLLKGSIDIWKGILARAPEDPVALAEMGYVRFLLGEDRPSALRLARRARESDPSHPVATNVLALLYLFLGYYESNVEIEQAVAKSDPAYVYPIANASLAYQLMGNFEMALEMAKKAVDLDPSAFVALLLKGAQHYYTGDRDAANAVWSNGRDHASAEVLPIFDTVLSWLVATTDDPTTATITLTQYRGDSWLNGWYGPYYVSLAALCGKPVEAVRLLEQATGFASSYRYLVAEPTLRPLFEHAGFRDLLDRRYDEWRSNLELFGSGLPVRPPELPSPGALP